MANRGGGGGGGGGGPSDYTGEMGSQVYVNYLPKLIP